jgi:hypothetical protein
MNPLLLFALSQLAAGSHAMERRGYAQPAFLVSVQPASGATYHRVDPNLGGDVPALSFAVGAFLSRKLGIEGEVVLVRDLSAPQRFQYNWSEDYIVHSRDTYLNALARIRVATGAEVVGGGGIVVSATKKTEYTETRYDYVTGKPVTTPRADTSQQVTGWSLTAGLDVAINPRSRVVVVPMLRIRLTDRPDPAGIGWTGAGGYAIQFGVGVRPSF